MNQQKFFHSRLESNQISIAIIGLGYVGLPLAVEFGKKFKTTGFVINPARIEELNVGRDSTLEVSPEELRQANNLSFTGNAKEITDANVFIVTVPTPIDDHKRPDLAPLRMACITIGALLKQDDVVIFESTVYPGATEEACVPILEKESGFKFNVDFFAGYSPERINPGDKHHRLPSIKKVTAGSTPEVAAFVDTLYKTIITAGTHKASSIKVAEAAKVIENTQRDVNIALINELAMLFKRLNLDTEEVLQAAGTKWNFLNFRPGLVGGHCIGVDPYYLTYKAEQIGYQPQVILAGRRINDQMGKYVAESTVKQLIQADKAVKGARVLVLGLTFKEDVPDIRNTKVIDIVRELQEYGIETLVHDPVANAEDAQREYDVDLVELDEVKSVDAVVFAVAHQSYQAFSIDRLRELCAKRSGSGVIVDVKNILDRAAVESAGLVYWNL